ncbi:WG repeat-containing protein [Peptococcus simiae]|uniref:WG repeat-containing protein n=1 Tax=Peptococcus simiae TaxID=1643805 RepID=A0ABW9GYM4_9FIRM
MKSLSSIILAVALGLGLVACGQADLDPSSTEAPPQTSEGRVLAAPFAKAIGPIDDKGRTVVYSPVDASGALTVESKARLVDDMGKTLLETDYRDIWPLYTGDYYKFRLVTDGPWGLMDAQGQVLQDPFADALEPFTDKDGNPRFSYQKEGLWGIYDPQSRTMTPALSESLPLPAGGGFVYSQKDLFGLAAGDGSPLVEPVFDWIGPFAENDRALYRSGDEYGMINAQGDRVKTLDLPGRLEATSFLNGLPLAYEKDGRWGLLDSDFKVLREPFADAAIAMISRGSQDDGYGLYEEKGRVGLLDAKGKVLRKPFADQVGPFTPAGHAVYRDGSQGGIIDLKGKEVTLPENQGLGDFNALGYVPFKQGGKWGVVNEKGRVVVKPTLAELRLFTNGSQAWFREKENGPWGIISLN